MFDAASIVVILQIDYMTFYVLLITYQRIRNCEYGNNRL